MNRIGLLITLISIFSATNSRAQDSDFFKPNPTFSCKHPNDIVPIMNIMGLRQTTSPIDISSQWLDLEITPESGLIKGFVRTGFYLLKSADMVELDLHSALEVTEIRWNESNLEFDHRLDHKLEIYFPTIFDSASWVSIEIHYNGIPVKSGFGSYVVTTQHNIPVVSTLSQPYGAGDWWPCKSDLIDKFDTLDIRITVPVLYSVASNGIIKSITPVENQKHTYHWVHRYPIVTYLVAFALTQYELFTDTVTLSTGPLPVMNYIYPGSSSNFKLERLAVLPVLEWYDTLLGPYPFHLEKYGHAQSPFGGGMEHQTMSFMGSFNIELIAHELVHHYFGNMITCRSWQEIWINEGLASFLGAYYLTQIQGGIWWPRWLEVKRNQVFSQPGGSVFIKDTSSIATVFNSRLTYAKGGLILNMLKFVMGEAPFFQALQNILQDEKLRFSFAGVPDFIQHFNAVHGSDLQWFFDQWYYAEGHMELNTEVQYSADKLTINLTQAPTHPIVNYFEGPLPFKLIFPNFDTTVIFWMTQKKQQFTFFKDEAYTIQDIIFDPHMDIIAVQSNLSIAPTANFSGKQNSVIYPSPAVGEFALDIHPKNNENKELKIFTIDGKQIWTHKFNGNFIRINRNQSWAAGVYILYLHSETRREKIKFYME
jgi:aminopeptidase N